MFSFYRLNTNKFSPIKNNHDYLNKLGFKKSSNGLFYNKIYKIANSILNIGIISDEKNIYDLMAFATSKEKIDVSKLEKIYNKNLKAINTLSMVKTAGGYGVDGGSGGLHNVNLDESYGGPRWWSYKSDDESLNELESWTQKQFRYNPEYLAVGTPVQIGEDSFSILATINANVSFARLNRNRQEVFLEYVVNNQLYRMALPSFKNIIDSGKYDGDLAQEINKYQLQIAKVRGGSIIFIRKKYSKGDYRGIWEVNSPDASPGFAYVDEDWKTSYSMHPEFLNDPTWTSGGWSPGRNSYQ